MEAQILTGKTAMITGAAQGMALKMAQLFAREGARVIMLDINEEKGTFYPKTVDIIHYKSGGRYGTPPGEEVLEQIELAPAELSGYTVCDQNELEYAMIGGVNDSPMQARQLAGLARKVGAHVNLIPLNHVEERKLVPSSKESFALFCKTLEENRVNYTVRRSLGSDVDAACGQLRRKEAT